MPHQEPLQAIVVNHRSLKQVVDWLLPPSLFTNIKAHGNALWKPRMLAMAAILWALSDGLNLKDRFKQAQKIVSKVFRWQAAPGRSYQGFLKMLRKWHSPMKQVIVPHLRTQMQEVLWENWKIAGHVVFAVDGSRVELPRTESLEDAYSPQRKKKAKQGKRGAKKKRKTQTSKTQSAESIAKKGNSPQMWLTLLWHVGTGLPWAWRTGPSDSSERDHLKEMLSEMPKPSLLTADAGFVGYDFWKAILDAGHDFVIRVGANVRLTRQLGCARQYDHTVYLWPDSAAKKEQPPLVLRLIVLHNGKHPVYLVTNLPKSQLNDRSAGAIYGARWGIELFFRTFKQTFGRHKLRSRTSENARLELDWSLLGLWCVCLLGQRELVESGHDPTRLSAAAAIQAVQATLREYRVRPETVEESLWFRLRSATLDCYSRSSSKSSRNYPRKKKRQNIGAPKITKATKRQIAAAQQLKQNHPELWLTA